MRVVVTGPTGFVGQCLLPVLLEHGHEITAVARTLPEPRLAPIRWRAVGSFDATIDWPEILDGAEAIVHLAGIAHVLDQSDRAMAMRYHAVNCAATLALARAAIAARVKRFVFMSSVRVHGNARAGTVFHETDVCVPTDEYGRSKLAAEAGLCTLARESSLEVVNLRPPLIYGPGVRANFLRILRWVDRGVPLPLASIANRRSFLYVENLVAAVQLALTHPGAAGQTFLLSDNEDLSTPALIRRLARALGKRARLLPIPASALRLGLGLIGRAADYERLCGDAALDCSHIARTLQFRPPSSVDAGLAETVRWYRQESERD